MIKYLENWDLLPKKLAHNQSSSQRLPKKEDKSLDSAYKFPQEIIDILSQSISQARFAQVVPNSEAFKRREALARLKPEDIVTKSGGDPKKFSNHKLK